MNPLLFTLSVFAIVPLAALLRHATESVAANRGSPGPRSDGVSDFAMTLYPFQPRVQ